jgi:DNA-binding MarR family transcriptional regulator
LNKKEEILKMYYEEHQKQQDIAQKLKVSQSYISQVIKEDERYNLNKETKHKESMIKKADYNKEYYKTYKRPKKEDNSYQELQAQLAKDTAELSYQSGYNISDYAYAKWNPSTYHRNSKGNLVIDRKLNVGFDVPKSINMNIKIPTQKYKNRCVYSY